MSAVALLLKLVLQEGDLDALLKDVSVLSAPGSPGPVLAFGDRAFPVVAAGAGRNLRVPVVAAARWERGRAVVLGHNGWFGRESLAHPDSARFLLNVVRWAADRPAPRVGVGSWTEAAARLRRAGIETVELRRGAWTGELDRLHAVLLPPDWPAEEEVEPLGAFIRAGGGFVSGVPGWGWLSLNPGKSLSDDLPAQRLLEPAGLGWADGTVERTHEAGFDAARWPPALVHAGRALDFLVDAAAGAPKADLLQASDAALRAVRAAPRALAARPLLKELRGSAPAKSFDRPLDRVLHALDLEELRALPPERLRAHPASAAFPGAVPADAPRVRKTLRVDLSSPGWSSTGLYAPPGAPLRISGSAPGLFIRIGCHTDRLWHLESWKRAPEIAGRWAVPAGGLVAASPWGGLVYLEGPGKPGAASVELVLDGAVEAPFFVLGETDPARWEEIRRRPAPWGELASRKAILSLPSTVLRELPDPTELLRFWDAVLDAVADLATIPRERARPERLVPDVQISAGYMHSGYPIMTHLDVERKMVDVAALKRDGWGFWHELGHNHQVRDWTFDGTGEVTCNLFSVFVTETLCGRPEGHAGVKAEQRKKRRAAHFADGAPFDAWKRDPFLALDFYLQLKEGFGWETYRRVFAEYRALPGAERPRSDDERRDQWLIRFSRACGRDLGPFFRAWGVPTGEAARKAVSGLPPWMPPE